MGKVFPFQKGIRLRARRTGKSPESRLKGAILDRLAWHRNIHVMCNAQDNRRLRTGLGVGSTDIVLAMAPAGRWGCLEVKLPGGKADPAQVSWMGLMKLLGCFCCVVHSPDEADEAIRRMSEGKSE